MAVKMKTAIWAAVITALATVSAAIIPNWINKNGRTSSAEALYFAGTVVEDGSNNSIAQAEITIVGRTEHYYSEGNGNFRISVKTEGDIRVRVVKVGYAPYERSYTLPDERVIVVLDKQK